MVVYLIYVHGDRVRETWDWFILIPPPNISKTFARRSMQIKNSPFKSRWTIKPCAIPTWWPLLNCYNPLWHHQMETFSALLAICAGNSPVTAQRPVTWSFDVFLICAWINSWVNNDEAGDLRLHRAHYDVTVMHTPSSSCQTTPLKIGCQ